MAQSSPEAEWIPLASSNVRAARYDPETKTLSVQFLSGAEYDYHDVPQPVADGLFSAGSPGRYVRDTLSGYSYDGG